MTAANEVNRGRRNVDAVDFPTVPPPDDVDVLVVGAGPTGLATAVDLARHGITVAVVDAAAGATLVRAGAFGHSARVVELFRRWGLLQRIRQEWTVPPEWNIGNQLRTSLAGHELDGTVRRSFDKAPGVRFSTEDPIRRPQTALQKVFLEHLAGVGVVISGGWRVTGLAQDASGITTEVTDQDSGGSRWIRSRYVVAADGSKSTVRQLAGISRQGEYATERHFRFVVRTARHAHPPGKPFSSGTNIIYNNTYSGFLAALNETDWRAYAGPYPLDRGPGEAELLDLARSAFGYDPGLEVVSVTPYFKSTRIAETFRRDRVLLVGDAAHVRTPGGNLGEGFGDVANLGWKLAAVVRGIGGDALLDSYDAERRPHNWRVADHALERGLVQADKLREIREIGVPADLDRSADALAKRAAIGAVLTRGVRPSVGVYFDERYDASPVIAYEDGQQDHEPAWDPHTYQPDGRPGHRAPNGNLDPFGVTLYDRIGSDVVLLCLGGDWAIPSAFEQAAERRGIELDVIHLDDHEVRAVYQSDYALIRPDFHVAWRGNGREVDADEVLDRVYGRGNKKLKVDDRRDHRLAGVGAA